MKENIPVLLLKKLSLLPLQEVRLELNIELTKKLIDLSEESFNNKILVVLPTNALEESPSVKDLPNIGVLAQIKSKLELPNGNYRIFIKGLNRVQILNYANDKEDKTILMGLAKRLYIDHGEGTESLALKRKLIELTKKYIKINPEASNSIQNHVNENETLDTLTDLIVNFIKLSNNKKINYMNEFNEITRAKMLIEDLGIELEIIKLNNKLDSEIRAEFEKEQKELLLKTKIEKLNEELGIIGSKETEIKEYHLKIETLDVSIKTKNKLFNELKRYEATPANNPDGSVIRNYLDTILALPFNKSSKEETSVKKAEEALNQSHYGMESAKIRIKEYVALKAKNKKLTSPILCLIGPPGVGKTTMAKGIADALKREFFKISVGGLSDSSELLGHRRTYLGSAPGKIISGIKKCEVNNPVILIDEVDKMVKDFKGDPSSVLLDILDSGQNKYFIDNYIEEPFDLSNALFILTANDEAAIPWVLKDRLEIIHIDSYTIYDKKDIAINYLIPNISDKYGITNITIKDKLLMFIIKDYTLESGVRELERLLDKLIRNIIIQELDINKLKEKDITNILGTPLYNEENAQEQNIGSCNILGVSPLGGHVINIQSILVPDQNELIITGGVSEGLKDNIYLVLSYLKTNGLIDYTKLYENSLHLHFNNNYTLEGESGSVGIATSIISLAQNKAISKDTAFSGKLDLYGNINSVNGIKEKIIAAYNNHIKTIYLPEENREDVKYIPDFILKEINIIFVSKYDEIYNSLFKTKK